MTNNSDAIRSFRRACDRCRAQKLKCTQDEFSTIGGACQRCIGAKLQCTFSRRAPVGRPSLKPKPRHQRKASSPAETLATIEDTKYSNYLTFPEHLETSSSSPRSSTSLNEFDVSPGPEVLPSLPLDSCLDSELPQASYISWNKFTLDSIIQKLSALTIEISQQCNLLSSGANCNSHPSFRSQDTFDNLPLFRIQHISEEFIVILTEISQTVLYQTSVNYDGVTQNFSKFDEGPKSKFECQIVPEYEAHSNPFDITVTSFSGHTIPISFSGNLNPFVIDTPLSLLILNFFVSLTRIYTIVLAHLQNHIIHTTASTATVFHGSDFEKLSDSQARSVKAHTAFRILLDTLRRCEDLLNFPDYLRSVRDCNCLYDVHTVADSYSVEFHSHDYGYPDSINLTCSGCKETTLAGRTLVSIAMARAVFKQESLIGEKCGIGGLYLLRKSIRNVKQALGERTVLSLP